jgi:cysteine desulfurase/selenocysteine lyase
MTELENNDRIARFRASFVRNPKLIHLNNAGQAPMSIPARDELIAWADRFAKEGAHVFPPLFQKFSEARIELGLLLGAEPNQVVFSQSAATAISQIALGLDLKAGDEIIVWDQEYPSNFYPWNMACERSGAKLVIARSGADLSTPLETIVKLVTPRTRVIATSWVQYRTGALMDLAALSAFARPKNIFTSADIIQGAGVLPFNFKELGLDAACGASHKWMCSSHSPGYFLLREEHFENIRPLTVGAMTYGTPDDLARIDAPMKPGPARFEPGGLPFVNAIALGASAKLIRECGIALIAQEAEWLARGLMHGLRERGYAVSNPHGPHFRGAIVNFSPGADARLKTIPEIEAKLASGGVSIGKRAPGIRLSVHAHNTPDDIERVLALL